MPWRAVEGVRSGELAALGLLERGTRLVDMAEGWAGAGDRDTAAIRMPHQQATASSSLGGPCRCAICNFVGGGG